MADEQPQSQQGPDLNELLKPKTQEEEIGFHKGALSVLVTENSEMYKLFQVTGMHIQAHVEALKKLGIEIK